MPDIDAYRFPRMVIILFFALGIMFIVATLRGKYDTPDDKAPMQVKKLKIPGTSYLLVIAYVALINFIGFYTATIIFMLVYMKYLGAKSWKTIIITTLCVSVFIYLLFSLQFDVPLPKGIAI